MPDEATLPRRNPGAALADGLSGSQARDLEHQHPGWRAWQSARNGQWHARLEGSDPPVLVHDDNPSGLAEQIRALVPHVAAPALPYE
jgi:hypothetical protein